MTETKRKKTEKQILRLAAEITYRKLKNIDVGFVTYTGCALTEDASHADISVAVYGSDADCEKSLEGLNRAAGFFRNLIGKAMHMRNAPEIRFVLDNSFEKMQKINSLIDEKSDPEREV